MTTTTETDVQTWRLNGFHTCDIPGCFHDAAIIADSTDHGRFCIDHTDIAALTPADHPDFGGWFRITDSHYPLPGPGVIFTVHPL
ncbi:hypothetical protein [Mycolicibacterium mageritense]|uniref:hypothetical protein n=1 Tax=Mycolicibacterium mageritense TaxID=53462 RepID=UPI0011D497FF|nr:hypothetical protein [Mycolicibacterium mageritense]TXI56478.1 MAG: hypothetical protein E6Q55_28855 [Mycolicibacterium mageritense]